MSKKQNAIPKDNNIIRTPLEDVMPENYLPYAVEVAKERALPDVRDGLKPVHRRILYGAYQLKAFPDRPYYKSARIVGDILGKYHPHGDTSVYDATVILAQDFSTREPLIDGHGNWGSIDGDNAAAMRYTEARLTPIAMEMLKDIDMDTVDFVPNYSDSEMEPKVLPSRYPNLLVNGSFGIAVGLATNIPPHNLGEVTDGILAYIDNPEINTQELMKYIKGPDLPTGGILIGTKSIASAYETGEGKVTYRAKTSIENLENGRVGIVITEFPYRRNKAKLLQTISEMTGDKKHMKFLESIADIRDESDRSGIRAVIELKKNADQTVADKVLKYLFKKTELQCNLSFNMVALSNGKPETMGLKTIIMHYVNHQKEIIIRRTKKQLETALNRFEIVEGFIKAISILDKVIETIRGSKSKKDAQLNLMNQFEFTEVQSNAILELMLYRLTGLEITAFEKEYKELEKLIAKCRKILGDQKELLKVVKSELIKITEQYKNPRRTKIIENEDIAKIDIDDLIVVEDIVVTLSKDGFIKRLPEKNYNRSSANHDVIEYRQGDSLKFCLKSNTAETLLFFTDIGNMYQTKGISIPEGKWKDKGEKIDSIIKTMNLDEESIVSVVSLGEYSDKEFMQIITSRGNIKKSSIDKFNTSYTKLQATKIRDSEKIIRADLVEKQSEFIKFITEKGLEFTVRVPELENSQRNVIGVEQFTLSGSDTVILAEDTDFCEYSEFTVGVTESGLIKSSKSRDKTLKLTKTNSDSSLLIFTSFGNVIKIESFIIREALDKGLQISNFVNTLDKNEKIIEICSVNDFNKNYYVITFTKFGLVKKTALSEFDGNYLITSAHKFKNEDDNLISCSIQKSEDDQIIILTKKGMGIKFLASSVNKMGRNASGVTGISLKDDDYVVFGDSIKTDQNDVKLNIQTKSKSKEEVVPSDIKLQNRAGRGSSVIMLSLEDKIIFVRSERQ